ncbi:MAG: GNAT family N-acetyltransferase [Candidatus Rokubacteria bacterium]|nr:GNAT family N-acetyltransferase [Candidatus Rokubacteria bacterium]
MSWRAGGYAIRRATPADHDAVARELAAYLDFLGEPLDGEGLDRDIARWQEAYDGARGVMLLVVDPRGALVGTAAVRRLEPEVGELKRMWIRPAHQGRGLGRPLLDACLAVARALGCRRLRLDSERRLEAAVHLYRAYGFSEIADYNGNPRAELWMEVRL